MRLFRSPFEQINLFLPVVLLSASLFEYFSGFRKLWEYENIMKYVQDLIFFNGLHVCLTFVFLFMTRTGFRVTKEFYSTFGKEGFLKILFVFCVTSFSFYLVHVFASSTSLIFILFYVGFTFFRRKHDLGQSKGLLRIMNLKHSREFSDSHQSQSFSIIQKLEHILINLFFYSSLVAILAFFNLADFLGGWKSQVFWSSFVLSLAICFTLSILAILSPNGLRLWKLLYSFRFYIKVLSPFSAISAYAGAAVHGTEYICVTDKILTAEQKDQNLRIKFSEIIYLILTVFVVFSFFRFPELYVDALSETYTAAIISIAVGIIFSHYYVDYLIFTPKHQFAKPLLKILSK